MSVSACAGGTDWTSRPWAQTGWTQWKCCQGCSHHSHPLEKEVVWGHQRWCEDNRGEVFQSILEITTEEFNAHCVFIGSLAVNPEPKAVHVLCILCLIGFLSILFFVLKGFLFDGPFAFSQHVCEHVWPCWIKAMIHQPSSSHGRFWRRELSTRPWPQGSMEFLNVRSMTCSGSANMLWKLISHRASLNSQQCSQGFSVFEPSNKVKWPPISEINRCCYLLPWKNHVFAGFVRAITTT